MKFQRIARTINELHKHPIGIRQISEEEIPWIDFFAFCDDELLPSRIIVPSLLADLVCSEVGYTPSGFLDGTSTKNLISLLASEANEQIGSEKTIWDIVDALESLRRASLVTPIKFTQHLSYGEAHVFWSRALGHRLLTMGHLVSGCKIEHVTQGEMRAFVKTCDRRELLAALVNNDASGIKTGSEMNPSRPIPTINYKPWRSLSWPEQEHYVSQRSGPLYTLHLFSPMKDTPMCHLRDLSGRIVERYTGDFPVILREGITSIILQVERYPNGRLVIHDVVYSSMEPKIHSSPYLLRRKHGEVVMDLKNMSTQFGNIAPLSEMKEETNISHMIHEDDKRVYLISENALDFEENMNGYIVVGSKGSHPLLVESVGGLKNGDFFVTLAALDGTDDVIVAKYTLTPDNTDVIFSLRRRGVIMSEVAKHTENISHLGIVVEGIISNISEDGRTCDVLSIEKVCDNLGRYDSVQVGELIAIR